MQLCDASMTVDLSIESTQNSEASIIDGWTKADTLVVFETLTLAVVAILVIMLVVRPLVKTALDVAKKAPPQSTVIRHIVVDYSKLPLPRLWSFGLRLYGIGAFCFGLGLGIGLNGLAWYFLHR